nr:glycosyltransferase family 4 protein [Paenibacillus turpanensis]
MLATIWNVPDVGGVWRFIELLQSGLERIGHEVDILGTMQGYTGFQLLTRHHHQSVGRESLEPLIWKKLQGPMFQYLHQYPWLLDMELKRYMFEAVSAYWGLEQYDIIHTQEVISTLAMRRVKPEWAPLVASIHGLLSYEVYLQFKQNVSDMTEQHFQGTETGKYFAAIEREGIKNADMLVSASTWLASELSGRYGFSSDLFEHSPYGMDIDRYLLAQQQSVSSETPGKKVILCVARLTMIKGVQVLLPALARLKQVRSDWVCWIAGDGEMKEQLMQTAAELGLSSDIVFLGHRSDIPHLLNCADITVFPSLRDNQPYAVLESMAAGIAPVVSDAGGLPELVNDGYNGWIFKAGDSEGCYHYLRHFLDNEDQRKIMGENAKNWCRTHFSLEALARRYEYLYRKCASNLNRG